MCVIINNNINNTYHLSYLQFKILNHTINNDSNINLFFDNLQY